MGRPKKNAEAKAELPKLPGDGPEKAHPAEGGSSEETPGERAQRISREAIARKAKGKADREAEAFGKAAKISEAYMKSEHAPIFLPFKDRDGKIVPSLVIASQEDFKRKENGDEEIDLKSRDRIPVLNLIVWVFSGASMPHQEIYDFEKNKV